ncbi:hypothetical protein GF356_01770 [candidate division GN15 bacterium]|nr:hypothetical protein [candidate division GN15 bacterium]
MMRTILLTLGILLLAISVGLAENQDPPTKTANTEAGAVADTVEESHQTVIVYYLHGNRRCPTCQKLESYTKEAVDSAFAEQLADSTVVWRVVNFQTEGNEHLAEDYELYTQSVILSRVTDDRETEWKNLDRIWKLVGDKDDFVAYIQDEVESFLNPAESKDKK